MGFLFYIFLWISLCTTKQWVYYQKHQEVTKGNHNKLEFFLTEKKLSIFIRENNLRSFYPGTYVCLWATPLTGSFGKISFWFRRKHNAHNHFMLGQVKGKASDRNWGQEQKVITEVGVLRIPWDLNQLWRFNPSPHVQWKELNWINRLKNEL